MKGSYSKAILHSPTSTADCIVIKEPPYAERHVRWCERSENESRKKTISVFLLLDSCCPKRLLLELYSQLPVEKCLIDGIPFFFGVVD